MSGQARRLRAWRSQLLRKDEDRSKKLRGSSMVQQANEVLKEKDIYAGLSKADQDSLIRNVWDTEVTPNEVKYIKKRTDVIRINQYDGNRFLYLNTKEPVKPNRLVFVEQTLFAAVSHGKCASCKQPNPEIGGCNCDSCNMQYCSVDCMHADSLIHRVECVAKTSQISERIRSLIYSKNVSLHSSLYKPMIARSMERDSFKFISDMLHIVSRIASLGLIKNEFFDPCLFPPCSLFRYSPIPYPVQDVGITGLHLPLEISLLYHLANVIATEILNVPFDVFWEHHKLTLWNIWERVLYNYHAGARAVFPILSMLAHSDTPNCRVEVRSGSLILLTETDVSSEEPLSINMLSNIIDKGVIRDFNQSDVVRVPITTHVL